MGRAAGDLQQHLSFDMLNSGWNFDLNTAESDINRIQNRIRDFSLRAKIDMSQAAGVVNKFLRNDISEDVTLNLLPNMNRYKRVFKTSLDEMSNLYKNMATIGVDLSNQTQVSDSLNSIFTAVSKANVPIAKYNDLLKNSIPTLSKFGIGLDEVNSMALFLSEKGFAGDNIAKIIEQMSSQLVRAQRMGKTLENDGINKIFSGDVLVAMQKFQNSVGGTMDNISGMLQSAKLENRLEILATINDKSLSAQLEKLSNIGSTAKDALLLAAIPVLGYVLESLINISSFVYRLVEPFGFVFDFIAQNFEAFGIAAVALGTLIGAAFSPVVIAVGAIAGGIFVINKLVGKLNALMEENAIVANAIQGIMGAIGGIVTLIALKKAAIFAWESKSLIAHNAMVAKKKIMVALTITKAAITNPLMLAAGLVAAGAGVGAVMAMTRSKDKKDTAADTLDEIHGIPQIQQSVSPFSFGNIETYDPTMSGTSRDRNTNIGSDFGGSSLSERVVRHEIRLFMERGLSAIASTGDRSNNGVLVMSFRD
jgi:hypothetical protein